MGVGLLIEPIIHFASKGESMKLKGFDEEFPTLDDYILKITYRIWEQRQIAKIRDWYGKRAPVYTPTIITKDVEKVVQATLETLHMFPDRVLLGEDVIGKELAEGTYYSSHRIFSTMTHLGNGAFGTPTNKKVKIRVIGDCICKNNQIIEEWLIKDHSAIVLAIGKDVEGMGREQGVKLKKNKLLLSPREYLSIWRGDGELELKDEALLAARAMERVFHEDDFNSVHDTHDRSAFAYFPSYTHCHGSLEIVAYLVSFLGSFTTRDFKVHHAINAKEANALPRVSLRWTLFAKHGANGLYGKPSNKELVVMGISHFEMKNNLVYRAYHLFDELSIWAQIECND